MLGHRIFPRHAWRIGHQGFMEDLWRVYGGFMEDLWKVYGKSCQSQSGTCFLFFNAWYNMESGSGKVQNRDVWDEQNIFGSEACSVSWDVGSGWVGSHAWCNMESGYLNKLFFFYMSTLTALAFAVPTRHWYDVGAEAGWDEKDVVDRSLGKCADFIV